MKANIKLTSGTLEQDLISLCCVLLSYFMLELLEHLI